MKIFDVIQNTPIKSMIYQLFCVLSLFTHILNDFKIGGVKLFFIPIFAAFLMSFFVRGEVEIVKGKYPIIQAGLTFLAGLLSSGSDSLFVSVTILVMIVSFRKIQAINCKFLLLITLPLSAVMLIYLLCVYYSIPCYRFQGFYNDPNYFVISILVLAYINIRAFTIFDYKVFKAVVIANLCIIFLLTLFSLSRTGTICLLLLYILSFRTYFVEHKTQAIVSCVVLLFVVNQCFMESFQSQIDNLTARFEGGDNDAGGSEEASDLRLDISLNSISNTFGNPIFFLLGIGPGQSTSHQIPGFTPHRSGYGDHNTYTSMMLEEGCICLLIFFSFVYCNLKKIFVSKEVLRNSNYRQLSLTFFLTILLFAASVHCENYLPFWFAFFLAGNYNLSHITIIEKQE